MLYAFFWIIPWHLNLDTRELPRRKHTTYQVMLQDYMNRVYYEEYEEVEHMARTPSGGQVNDVLLVAFSVIACSMSSPEMLHTTSSGVEDKSEAAMDVLFLYHAHFFDVELICD